MKREQLIEYLLAAFIGSSIAFAISYKVLNFKLIESLSVTVLAGIAGYVLAENNDLKWQRKRNWDYLELEGQPRDERLEQLKQKSDELAKTFEEVRSTDYHSALMDLTVIMKDCEREREALREERMRLGLDPFPSQGE